MLASRGSSFDNIVDTHLTRGSTFLAKIFSSGGDSLAEQLHNNVVGNLIAIYMKNSPRVYLFAFCVVTCCIHWTALTHANKKLIL